MADTARSRPKVTRSETLARIYAGDQQNAGSDERWTERKGSIQAFYASSQPVIGASEPVVIQQINRFAETNSILMNALNEIARIHPFISIAVVAFKAVVSLELSRRDNDKRITLLLVKMQDTMSIILELDKLGDTDGPSLSKLESLIGKLKTDIEDCGSVCDTYRKKHVVSRLLKSKLWEPKLQGYVDLFEQDKQDIRDVLAMYSASGISALNEKLDDFRVTISNDVKEIKAFFDQLRSPKEKQLLETIRREGGEGNFKDDKDLQKLLSISEGKQVTSSDSTPKSESKVLATIREEVKEDLVKLLVKDREIFDRKLKAQTEILIAETRGTMRREGDRIINAVVRGPYDRIVDPALHKVWKDMQFRGSVKARQLVLALRELYWEQLHPSSTDSRSVPNSPSLSAISLSQEESKSDTPLQLISTSDEWTLRYINIVRIQPLIEAFDDDASGFITVREANQFTSMRPSDWTVPRWIAYWAAGFQITLCIYCDRIKRHLSHMQDIAESTLPANRVPVNAYLASSAVGNIERVLAGISKGQSELRWDDISDSSLMDIVHARNAHEEERMEKKLKELKWYVDESNTLLLITGPGRVEMYLMTLLYLLVKRHCLVIQFAKTVVLHSNEFIVAERSLDIVWTAVQDRLDGLKAVFRQQNLNVENEVARMCHGLLSCFEETLENFASMRTDYYVSMANTSVLFSPEAPETVDGLDAASELSYGVMSNELDTRGYECGALENLNPSADSLQGLWHGYEVYTPELPQEGLSSLTIYENLSENTIKGQALEPVGYSTFEGTRQVKDGRLLFNFSRKYDGYEIRYYYCGTFESSEVEGDTLKGFWCLNLPGNGQLSEILESTLADTSWASSQFVFQRKPVEFFLCRPGPDVYAANRIQALWQYAFTAIRYRVQSKLLTRERMKIRRATRKRYMDLFMKYSGDTLSADESVELKSLIQTIAPEDLLYYRSLARRADRRITSYTHYCDSCGRTIEVTRYMCHVCTAPEKLLSRETVDICGDCIGLSFSAKSTPPAWNHKPNHDILQTRIALHSRKYVAAAEKLSEAKQQMNKVQTDYTCLSCKKQVTKPVWVCITCKDLVLVCPDCNLQEQRSRSWAFSLNEPNTDAEGHNWCHPLVLCQPAPAVDEQDQGHTDRIATLEEHMAQITERMKNIERLISQVLDRIPRNAT